MLADIRIIGDINEEQYDAFCIKLDAIEHINPKTRPKMVTLEIVSNGGSSHLALAFAERMRLSPVKFKTVANGYVASAATLILAKGDYRQMTKNSWVMVHEDSGEFAGTVYQLEQEVRQLRRQEDQWNTLLAATTKHKSTKQDFDVLHKEGDVYLTPQECLDLGLIDEII